MRQFLTWCVLVMGVATAAAQGPSVQLNNTLDSNGLSSEVTPLQSENFWRGKTFTSVTSDALGTTKRTLTFSAYVESGEYEESSKYGKVTYRFNVVFSSLEKLTIELRGKAKEEGFNLEKGEKEIDDVLTYALFPQIGLKFLKNRGNPEAFEPAPTGEESAPKAVAAASGEPSVYSVNVNGQTYVVQVAEGGDIEQVKKAESQMSVKPSESGTQVSKGEPLLAPLAGNIFKVNVSVGQKVAEGEVLIILEAMKMETEVKAPSAGTVRSIKVAEGNAVSVGDELLTMG